MRAGSYSHSLGVEGESPAAAASLPVGASVERRDRRCPCLAVAGKTFRAKVRAQREELGERTHRLDVSKRGDADEPVRVEVVAEEDRACRGRRRERARPAVVEEVALVDRLEPDGEALLGERREDRLLLALLRRAKGGRPELALAPGLDGDRLPERRRARAKELARRLDRALDLGRRRGPSRRTSPRTGTARRRRRARAGGGRARRSARCRRPGRGEVPHGPVAEERGRASRPPAARVTPGRPTGPRSSRRRSPPGAVDRGIAQAPEDDEPAAVASGFPESVPAW